MNNLLSEAAQRHRESAERSGNTKWLSNSVDVGAVVAKDQDDAKNVLAEQVQKGVRLLSGNEARDAAERLSLRAYYVVGKVKDSPDTWQVADCIEDFTVQAQAVA